MAFDACKHDAALAKLLEFNEQQAGPAKLAEPEVAALTALVALLKQVRVRARVGVWVRVRVRARVGVWARVRVRVNSCRLGPNPNPNANPQPNPHPHPTP